MKLNSIYSLMFLMMFSLTCISCSHSSVRTAEGDLSDEEIVNTASADEETVKEPVALMSDSDTSAGELDEEKAPSEEEGATLAQADVSQDVAQSPTSEESAVLNSDETSSTDSSNSLMAKEESQSVTTPAKSKSIAPHKNQNHKNWQRIEKKPTAQLAVPAEEDRAVAGEIEKALTRDEAPTVAQNDVLSVKEPADKKDPNLASVEISSFTQRHGWLVAFSAASLIIFLFFTLTRNRAKKDMTL